MDIKSLKEESKGFAFRNKWLIWKPLVILSGIIAACSLVALAGYAIDLMLGTFLESMISILSWIISPVLVAGLFIMLKNWFRGNKQTFEEALEVVKPKWSNFFFTYVMVSLFTSLWSLLFLIPGIVKSYAYSQALYIQAENPDMGWKECIDRSQKMMDGHKWRLFCLGMSYLGWAILCAFTFGILYLWVAPKMQQASFLFYLKVSGIGYGVELEKERLEREANGDFE